MSCLHLLVRSIALPLAAICMPGDVLTEVDKVPKSPSRITAARSASLKAVPTLQLPVLPHGTTTFVAEVRFAAPAFGTHNAESNFASFGQKTLRFSGSYSGTQLAV